jgi:RHS repeat-associated protein
VAYGDTSAWYLHLPHSIATDDGTAWTYSAADGLGSVRQRLDGLGGIDGELSYRPFGTPLEGDGGDPYGFTGEAWDGETGLLYLRARYYDSRTGRFLSQEAVVRERLAAGNAARVHPPGEPSIAIDIMPPLRHKSFGVAVRGDGIAEAGRGDRTSSLISGEMSDAGCLAPTARGGA